MAKSPIKLALSPLQLMLSEYYYAVSTNKYRNSTMVNKAILATVKAKVGKEQAVEDFLKSALQLANEEEFTTVWFAIKIDASTFGIFDAFSNDAGRDAHLAGPIATALMANAEALLSEAPSIKKVDVLAAKLNR